MNVVGLDLSLTHTGVVILDGKGAILSQSVIRSKPSGDSYLAETLRIIKIAEEAVQRIDEFSPVKNPDLVVIENLAFMARNTSALTQLAGLSHLVRTLLSEFKWPYVLVAPSTLKKFITSKGNSDKNIMMMEIFKQYGHTFLDDNIADAYGLAAVGLAMLEKPINKLTVPQAEVIKLLNVQL
jgi:crossover junction endodeoxyribonuclease RuvC